MQYLGGKSRVGKVLMNRVMAAVLERGAYIEPFVGGASMMIQAPSDVVRIGGDANAALITLWKALADGWVPPGVVSEDTYRSVKDAMDSNNPLTAFVGFGCSFGGKWFAGYARSGSRNYAANARASLLRKVVKLRGVTWVSGDYRTCPLLPHAVIYCDPPYAGTTTYAATEQFDHGEFWAWCLAKHEDGHAVFVSEYAAPASFKMALEVVTKTDLHTKTGRERRVERLFIPQGAKY